MNTPDTILIIDNDSGSSMALGDTLEANGFTPVFMGGGNQALEWARRHSAAVALIDLQLKDMSGLSVIGGLKERLPDIECILITEGVSQALTDEAVGAYALLQKPYNIKRLLVTIRRAMEKRAVALALNESPVHVAAIREVAERKRLENTLRESENRFRELFAHMTSGVAVYEARQEGQDFVIRDLNQAGALITHTQRDEVIGKSILEVFPGVIRFGLIDGLREVWRTGKTLRLPPTYYQDEHLAFWAENRIYKLPTGEVVAVFDDITARKLAEDAVQNSERYYRGLIENSNDVIAVIDANGTIGYISPSIRRIFGYDPQELIGQGFLTAIHPAEQAAISAALQHGIDHPEETVNLAARYRHKDGSWRIIEGTAQNRLHASAIAGIVANYRDITERKQTEEALLESEERFRSLYENATVGLYRTSPDGDILIANPTLVRMLGYQSFEALAQRDLRQEGFNPEYSREDFCQRIEREGSIFGYETVWKRKDGSPIWVRESARVVRDAQGNSLYYDGTVEDITARKQAEAALYESQERYRLIADNIDDTVWLMDLNLRTVYISPSVTKLRGYTLEEITTLPLDQQLAPESLARALQAYSSVLMPEQLTQSDLPLSLTIELEFYRKDGSTFWSENTFTLVRDTHGTPINILGVGRDISERKRAEQEVRHQLAELEALYENGLIMSGLLEPHEIGQRLIDVLAQKLNWHHAVVRLYNPLAKTIQVIAFNQPDLSETERVAHVQRINREISQLGQGLSGWVIQHGEAVRCGNVIEDKRYIATFPGICSGLYVPLEVGNQVIGSITVESVMPDAFDEQDERLLITLAAQAAISIENAQLYQAMQQELAERRQADEALRQYAGRLQALYDVDREILVAQSPQAVVQSVLHYIRQMTNCPQASITLFDFQAGEALKFLIRSDTSALSDNGLHQPLDMAWVTHLTQRKEIVLNDLQAEQPDYLLPEIDGIEHGDVRSLVYISLIAHDEVVGVLNLASDQPHAFNAAHLETAREMSVPVAIAIRQARLYEQIQQHATELEQRVHERTEELRALNAALARASRLKDEFLASMSHELRTPLTGILNISEALQEQVYGDLNEKQLHALNTIETSGRHLLGLINDILDVSKIEAGQLQMEWESCSLADICQSSLQMIKGLAQKKRLSVSYSINPADINLVVDPRRLKQILVNLLSNAAKFTPDGGQFGLQVEGHLDAGDIQFSVWDTGIGIAAQDMPRLFRPFTQLDSSLSRQHSGTGLGLTIVQRLADLHGGSVGVESTPGHGSRFMVTLPWRIVEPNSADQPRRRGGTKPFGLSLASRPNPEEPFTILLADDNDINASFYTDYLERKGFRVVVARHGEQAIQLTQESHPDLILMDIQMPGLDGLEATRRIRASSDPHLAQVPIIALTALTMPGDAERCFEAGANEYLGKPVSLNKLIQTLTDWLSRPPG